MPDPEDQPDQTPSDRLHEAGPSPEVQRREQLADALNAAGYTDVYVLAREDARDVLGEHCLDILEYLRDHDVRSVSSLADGLGRDTGNVSRDLRVLADVGLVNLVRDGQSKVPTLVHETVVVEPLY